MPILENIFLWVLYASLAAALIILLVIFIKNVFKNKLNAKFYHYLWLLVFIRLLIPYAPESHFSIFNLLSNSNDQIIDYQTSNSSFLTIESENLGKRQLNDNKNYLNQPKKEEAPQANFFKDELSREKKEIYRWEKISFKKVLKIGSYVWGIGFLSIVLFVLLSTIAFNKKVRNMRKVNDTEIINRLNSCKEKLGIRKPIGIYCGKSFKSPFIYGFFHPSIYLSENILKKVDYDQLNHILLHELIHYKRKDLFSNLFVGLAAMIHWFNPFVWVAVKKMRVDTELACDQSVLEIIGENNSISYGMTLIELSKMISMKPCKTIFSAYFFENNSQIERRIIMIKSFKKSSYRSSILSIVLLLFVASMTLTNAQNFNQNLHINNIVKKNNRFQLDDSSKWFNNLDWALDFVDVDFYMPHIIPLGYELHDIYFDNEDIIHMNFLDRKDKKENHLRFYVSKKDLIQHFKDQYAKSETYVLSNTNFNVEPMRIGNIEGQHLTIIKNIYWTEKSLKVLKKKDTIKIKHHPTKEVINKYFIWENKGIWYAIEYYWKSTSLDGTYSSDETSKEDMEKILYSLKSIENIQTQEYKSKVFEGSIHIYNQKHLKKAEAIIGFLPKFPLKLKGGFVPTSSITSHKIDGEDETFIGLETIFQLKDQPKSSARIELSQQKNTYFYDLLEKQGYFEGKDYESEKKIKVKITPINIEELKVFHYERTSKETGLKQYYIWKEGEITYKIEFSGKIKNKEKIIKNLINEPSYFN